MALALMALIWAAMLAVPFALPFVVRSLSARLWLRPFEARRVTDLLAYSWVWACFGAPVVWLGVVWFNQILLPQLTTGAVLSLWLRFGWLPIWGIVVCWLMPYFLLCLGFDWWLAWGALKPRSSIEGHKIALWACGSNLIYAACVTGIATWLVLLLNGCLLF